DGIRDLIVTGVQTCALPIFARSVAGGLLSVPLSVGFRRLGRPSVLPFGVRTFLERLAAPAVTRPALRSVAPIRMTFAAPPWEAGLPTVKEESMRRIFLGALLALAVTLAGVAMAAGHTGKSKHATSGRVVHVIQHATTDA